MKRFTNHNILLVFLTLMLVSSCLVGFAQEKVISFCRPNDLVALDPLDNWMPSNYVVDYMIYDRLIEMDSGPPITFIPGLATEWSVNPDGTEYTFKLREGVKFHNGEPFNAECVKVTLERFVNDRTLKKASVWVDLKEVEVVDDYTTIIRFSKPNVICLYNLFQIPMLPAEAFKEKGIELFDNPIGTGPFTWGHWKRGQEVVVYKNPDYWGETAYMDKFEIFFVNEVSTRLAAVLTGEVDIVDVMSAELIPAIEASDNAEVVRMLAWDQVYLALKTSKPPFSDKKFREAIALAIDKEGIAKAVIKGGRVSTGILPEGVFGFNDGLVPIQQDIEKAKKLVEESSYDGRTIDIMVPMGWIPNEKDFAQVILDNMREIGINAQLSILEAPAFVERRAAGDFDTFLNQDSNNGDVDKFISRAIAVDTYGLGNIDPELKRLIQESATIVDEEKRTDTLRKIEDMVNTDFAPVIMLNQFVQISFKQKAIKGVVFYGNKFHDLRYAYNENW